MGKTHLVVPDIHAHWEHDNERADWLGKLIVEVKPDVLINIGDQADMPSLSGYDQGKRTFQGRTYKADINAHLEFQERMWEPVLRQKKRLPYSIFCIGNHEHRITRAINSQPELDGAIGLNDLQLKRYYDKVVDYDGNTPGSIDVDGVVYGHFFISGISGRSISSEHSAYQLLTKNFKSSTCGHSHLLDFCTRTSADGSRLMGLVAGCYQDYNADWAGEANKLWWRGVVVKRNVEDGYYEPQFISLESLKKEFG